MLLFVVAIAAIALLALLVANMFGSVLAGWITIWASTVGLLLLLADGLRDHKNYDDNQHRRDRQDRQERHGNGDRQDTRVAPLPRLDVTSPDDREPSVATKLTDAEVELHPDIWPPEHPVQETPGDDNRVEPRRASEGQSLHPDIWP